MKPHSLQLIIICTMCLVALALGGVFRVCDYYAATRLEAAPKKAGPAARGGTCQSGLRRSSIPTAAPLVLTDRR